MDFLLTEIQKGAKMRITALLENTTNEQALKSAHGLSLYIETGKHKVLFDTGPNGFFADNALKLGISLEDVDTLIISHGHSDHGGGLKRFLEINKKAKIYVRPTAFEGHSIKVLFFQFPVSLDKKLYDPERFVYTDAVHCIDDELLLFSDVQGKKCLSSSGNKLYKRASRGIEQDDFDHEHNLLIACQGKSVLLAGCAHRGIVNIVERAEELTDGKLDVAIGGFHLYNSPTGKSESDVLINEVANALSNWSAKYCTCHCTGKKAFNLMHRKLGSQMEYLSTGRTIEV